jgi:EAL domain-containing protein (putative c-di-GMP-specific phosphodiesterase class I)
MMQGNEPPAQAATASFGMVARQVVGAPPGGRYERDGANLTTRFQPVHSVDSGEAIGDEALLEASHAGRAAVDPRELFAAEDDAGKVRLDWTSRALHLRNYAVVDPGDRLLFIDVHPEALPPDPDAADSFVQLVRFYGLVPERLCLQVLETGSDEARLARAVDTYRELGFAIAVGHFGQGCSNFYRVVRLRPRFVKVDRSRLHDAVGETRSHRMLPGFVRLLKETGTDVIVDGIANARDAIAAIEAGADYLQGHHFGTPQRTLRDEKLPAQLVLSARRLLLR